MKNVYACLLSFLANEMQWGTSKLNSQFGYVKCLNAKHLYFYTLTGLFMAS